MFNVLVANEKIGAAAKSLGELLEPLTESEEFSDWGNLVPLLLELGVASDRLSAAMSACLGAKPH